jgi:hypothetical protein
MIAPLHLGPSHLPRGLNSKSRLGGMGAEIVCSRDGKGLLDLIHWFEIVQTPASNNDNWSLQLLTERGQYLPSSHVILEQGSLPQNGMFQYRMERITP